jgi:hypothetical protein
LTIGEPLWIADQVVKTEFGAYERPEISGVFVDWPLFYACLYTFIILFALFLTVCCKRGYPSKIEMTQQVKRREK